MLSKTYLLLIGGSVTYYQRMVVASFGTWLVLTRKMREDRCAFEDKLSPFIETKNTEWMQIYVSNKLILFLNLGPCLTNS